MHDLKKCKLSHIHNTHVCNHKHITTTITPTCLDNALSSIQAYKSRRHQKGGGGGGEGGEWEMCQSRQVSQQALKSWKY